MVIKPSELTSLTALELGSIAHERLLVWSKLDRSGIHVFTALAL